MSGDYFYTISVNEAKLALERYGYRDDGLAGYVFATQIAGTIPLYRLLRPTSGDHLYTTWAVERDNAISAYGYEDEGIAGFVYDGAVVTGVVPLYRLANLINGHHFYTISKAEYEFALAQLIPYTYIPGVDIADILTVDMSTPVVHVDPEPAVGKPMYRDESIACYVHDTQVEHSLPFRRLLQVAGDTLPAAETPILETILDLNNNLIAPFHASGVFEMQPGERLELRLRAIYPSYIRVRIDGQALIKVNDNAIHPELDTAGYYRISEVRAIDASDSRFFWRVLVVLPLDKRGSINYALTIHNISQNLGLSGIDKEALPLQITVFRTPVLIPKPSSLFFDAPDAKHNKKGLNPAFIADDVTLAGWLLGPYREEAYGTEDWHYYILPDNDFIERNYSATTPPLDTAIMPGSWYTQVDNMFKPNVKIALTGGNQPNASTFLMPGQNHFTVELNAWHASKHNGQVPNGWVADPDPNNWPDVFWAFNVVKPLGIAQSEPDLKAGDYVIITGALVEDSAHIHLTDGETPDGDYWMHMCWFNTFYGHGGWLEIHPLDSIRRVEAPKVCKHAQVVQLCNNGDDKTPTSLDQYLMPTPSDPPSDGSWLMFREIIDDRFTDMSTIGTHTVEISRYDPTKLHVSISLNANKGCFKAVYLLWWEQRASPRPAVVPTPQTQSFITSDNDEIQFVIEPNTVGSDIVEFQLCLGGGLTWEKRMNLPDGLGNSWNLIVKDKERCNTEGLWANQVSNGQVLTFSKEKGFPRGMTKVHELPLSNLGNLPGGTRVTFTWSKD